MHLESELRPTDVDWRSSITNSLKDFAWLQWTFCASHAYARNLAPSKFSLHLTASTHLPVTHLEGLLSDCDQRARSCR